MPQTPRVNRAPPPRAAFEKITTSPASSFVLRRVTGRRFEAAYHYHPEIELTWIVKSSGHRFVGDSVEAFGAGDLVLLGPKLPHVWLNPPGCRRAEAVVLQFLPGMLGEGFLKLPEMRSIAAMISRAQRGIVFSKPVRERVAAGLEALMDSRGAARISRLIDILDRAARDRHSRDLCSARYAPAVQSGDEGRVDAIYRYVMANFRETIFQPDVAKRAGMRPAVFSRFFRRCTGRSFTQTVNDVRLGQVAELLLATDRTVAEICFECGFENLANFNRQFRRRHGMPPTEWRRLARESG
jgi:AraC-like DNA-binding protein